MQQFGAPPAEYGRYEDAKIVILPVPYEATTSYQKGTAGGPEAIINASRNMELYDEELLAEPFKAGLHTLQALETPDDPVEASEMIAAAFRGLTAEGKLTGMLGGEHTITLGAVRALKETYPDLSVLHFDAHADLRTEYEGQALTHASVMHYVSQEVPVMQVGVRSLSMSEADRVDTGNITTAFAMEHKSPDSVIELAREALTDHVYITVDLDFFDPSVVPAVGTPEPGGFDWWYALDILRWCCSKKEVVGFDVNELCPREGDVNSDFFAARLTYRLIGYLARYQLEAI